MNRKLPLTLGAAVPYAFSPAVDTGPRYLPSEYRAFKNQLEGVPGDAADPDTARRCEIVHLDGTVLFGLAYL